MKTSRTFLLALAIISLTIASCTNDTSDNSDNIYEQQSIEKKEIKNSDV